MPTSDFVVISSNDLDVLAEICANIIRTQPLADPLQSEQLLVMNLGMRTYLSQCLARYNGIASRCDYLQIWQLIWSVYRSLYPFVENIDLYDRDHLTLSLIALHEEWGDGRYAECAPLRDYVANDSDGSRLYELAARIADVFDQYQVYRPEWIAFANTLTDEDFAVWARGQGSGRLAEFFRREARGNSHCYASFSANVWQFRLWTLLRDNLHLERLALQQQLSDEQKCFYADDRSRVLQRLHRDLSEHNPQLNFAVLPQRLFIFGVSALPRQVLALLFDLAAYTRIYLMLLNPCMDYWGDLRSAWKEDFDSFRSRLRSSRLAEQLHPRAALRQVPQVTEMDWGHYEADSARELLALCEGNSLLLSLGRQGQDNLFMLLDHPQPPAFIDAFVTPQGEGVLHCIQRQLLQLHDAPDEKITVSRDDCSLQIHSCHTLRRELEVLRDAILTRFKEAYELGRPLLPRDIVVMVPTINEYAPYIHAVFGGQAEDSGINIPYAISDRTAQEQNPVADSLLTLLEMTGRRITATLVMELLAVAPLARRFGLTAEETEIIAGWISASGIHWGLDFEDVREVSAIDLPGTFSAGLQRMLYGIMSGTEVLGSGADIEGSDAVVFGKFYAFVQALGELRAIFTPHLVLDPDAWGQLLVSQVIDRFYAEEEHAHSSQLQAVRDIVARLQKACLHLRRPPRINLTVFRAMLAQELAGQRDYRPFLRDRVNFCSLIPMRAVPFRHVFLLGINDLSFPREERAPSFNLMMLPGMFRRGDRSRAIDDRYLFLEALLSARESLYISYLGQSPVDGRELQPSVLVNELLDYLTDHFIPEGESEAADPAAAIRKRFVARERLLAFDRLNYAAGGPRGLFARYPSFDSVNYRLHVKSSQISRASLGASQHWGLSPAAELHLDCAELLRFYRSPCRHFLTSKLGITLDSSDAVPELEEQEPFALERLERGRLLEQLLAMPDPQAGLAQLAGLGVLPYAVLGLQSAAELSGSIRVIRESLRRIGSGGAGSVRLNQQPFSVQTGDELCQIYLSAELQLPLIRVRTYKEHSSTGADPGELLDAALRVLCATLADRQRHALTIVYSSGELRTYAAIEPELAPQLLGRLLYYYVLGQTRALPVCHEFLSNPPGLDVERGFGFDEECRYIFASPEALLADAENLRLASDFAQFYAQLAAAMPCASAAAAGSAGSQEE